MSGIGDVDDLAGLNVAQLERIGIDHHDFVSFPVDQVRDPRVFSRDRVIGASVKGSTQTMARQQDLVPSAVRAIFDPRQHERGAASARGRKRVPAQGQSRGNGENGSVLPGILRLQLDGAVVAQHHPVTRPRDQPFDRLGARMGIGDHIALLKWVARQVDGVRPVVHRIEHEGGHLGFDQAMPGIRVDPIRRQIDRRRIRQLNRVLARPHQHVISLPVLQAADGLSTFAHPVEHPVPCLEIMVLDEDLVLRQDHLVLLRVELKIPDPHLADTRLHGAVGNGVHLGLGVVDRSRDADLAFDEGADAG